MSNNRTEYNWTTNKPDENSEDFAAVISWLASKGVPPPTIFQLPIESDGWATANALGYVPGEYPGTIMTLQFAGDPGTFMADMVLNDPGEVARRFGATGDLRYPPVEQSSTDPNFVDDNAALLKPFGTIAVSMPPSAAGFYGSSGSNVSIGTRTTAPDGKEVELIELPGFGGIKTKVWSPVKHGRPQR